MQVLDDRAVRELLGPTDLRPALADVVRRLRAGEVECAPRVGVGHGPLGQVTHLMLARDRAHSRVVTKLIDYDPMRPTHAGRPSVSGVVTYMEHGEPVFVASAATFTAIRTAACTAFAIDLLARPGTVAAAIVGAGVQADEHARQLARVRDVQDLRITGRSSAHVRELIARLESELPRLSIAAADDVRQACAGAHVVITATSAVDPVLFARDLQPGACVALVGSGVPSRREAAGEVLAHAARVVVETQEAAWAEAGDLLLAEQEGHIDRSRTVELATLVDDPPPWRADEISIYKSVGAAWEDLACAEVLASALSGGVPVTASQ